MLYDNQFFFVTKKIYENIDTSAFLLEKKNFIEQTIDNYRSLTALERLSQLINYLNTKLSPDFFKSGEDFRYFRRELTIFYQSRAGLIPSPHVLSVEQSVVFFEELIFDLFNQDKVYALSLAEKKGLCNAFSKGFGHCETGIAGGFYDALAQYQRSYDWVGNVLCKLRMQALTLLNQDFDPDNSQSVHTFIYLIELANEKGLALEKNYNQDDPYSSLQQKESLGHFFNANYISYFYKYYEAQILECLLNHLIDTLKLRLPSFTHFHEPNRIEFPDVDTIINFLSLHFQDKFEGKIEKFVEYNAEVDSFKMVSIKAFRDLIAPALIQHLQEKSYIVAFDKAVPDKALQSKIYCLDGLAFKDFYDIKLAIEKIDIAKLFSESKIFDHTQFISFLLKKTPNVIFSVVKYAQKNPDLRRILDGILENIQNTEKDLSTMYKTAFLSLHEYDFLRQEDPLLHLSKKQLEYPFLLRKLNTSAFTITELEDNYRVQRDYMFYNYPEYFDINSYQYLDFTVLKHQALDVARYFLETPTVDYDLFINNIAFIEPRLFKFIMAERLNKRLSPIFVGSGYNYETDLEKFIDLLDCIFSGNEDFQFGYHQYFKIKNYYHNTSLNLEPSKSNLAILIYDDWYKAFLDYRQKKRDKFEWSHLFTIFKMVLINILRAFKKMLFIVIYCVIAFARLFPIDLIVLGIYALFLLMHLFDCNVSLLKPIHTFFKDWSAFLCTSMGNEARLFTEGVCEIIESLLIFVRAIYDSFSKVFSGFQTCYFEAIEKQKFSDFIYQKIYQMLHSDIPAEREKAEILEKIYFLIKKEPVTFAPSLLSKAYSFTFKSQNYYMSFNEVMSFKCAEFQEFSLEKTSFFSFFASKSSKKQMDLAPKNDSFLVDLSNTSYYSFLPF